MFKEFKETGRKFWRVFHENYFILKAYPEKMCRDM